MDLDDPDRPFQGFNVLCTFNAIIVELIVFPVTLILLVISTTALENSLDTPIKTVCTKSDISAHYERSVWTLFVGTILVVQVFLELAIPIVTLFSTLVSGYISKFSSRHRYHRWKEFVVDLFVDIIACCVLAVFLIPWVLLTRAWIDALGAEFYTINLTSMVNQEMRESPSCCGSSTYTHNLVPNSTLNFASEIFHCRLPREIISKKAPICCCFEPKRVISYLNLAAYNILFFAFRSVFLICIVAFKVGANLGRAVEGRIWDQAEGQGSRNFPPLIRNNKTKKNKLKKSKSIKSGAKRKFNTKKFRNKNKIVPSPDVEPLNPKQPPNDGEISHFAYNFHSCTVEYWMDLIFRGVKADGLQNVHFIGVLNFVAEGLTPTAISVIKDAFGGYIMLVKSGDKVKGLVLASGKKIDRPILARDCIKIRTARMHQPSDFSERIFSKDEEIQKSLHLGGILIECRLDAYLGSVQILENSGGIYSSVKLGVRNYSKKDVVLTEVIDGGFIQIISNKNKECRGIALVYCPNKIATRIPIPPGSASDSNSTNRDHVNYFLRISIREE